MNLANDRHSPLALVGDWARSLLLLVALIALFFLVPPAFAANEAVDLPACDVNAPGMDSGIAIGFALPYAADAAVAYAARLAATGDGIAVCGESWRQVLPRFAPWAPALERGIGYAAFVVAFLAAVAFLYAATGRKGWHRVTLVGVLSVAGLSWLLAVGLLTSFSALGGQRLVYGTAVSLRLPRQAQPEWFDVADARALESLLVGRTPVSPAAAKVDAVAPAPAAADAAAPSGEYGVHHRLNLRAAPGVQSDWLAFVDRGEKVTFDGAREGDWWRIRTASGRVGWTSSLWLRRPQETARPVAESALPKVGGGGMATSAAAQ